MGSVAPPVTPSTMRTCAVLSPVLVVLAGACQEGGASTALWRPTPPSYDMHEVGRLDLTIRPRAGRIELTATTARRSFDYGNGEIEWTTCEPGASCLPPQGSLALWTDPAKVTFRDFDGTCYSNGAVAACPDSGPCAAIGAFCAPMQLVSNVANGPGRGVLPDVVIQLAQLANQENAILGCRDDLARSLGICRPESGKVDSTGSNLTSPIPGNSAGTPATSACSYCYGNPFRVGGASVRGLADAVVSGAEPTLAGFDTDTFVMQLVNNRDFNVGISVHAATPVFAPPGSQVSLDNAGVPADCVTPGVTRVTVSGGGFGPPAACLGPNAASDCPSQGAQALGYEMLLVGAGGELHVGDSIMWSDREVSMLVPAAFGTAQVRLAVPFAPARTTTDVVRTCATFTAGPQLLSGAKRASGGPFTIEMILGNGLAGPKLSGGPYDVTIENLGGAP